MISDIDTVPVSSIRWLIATGKMAGMDMNVLLQEFNITPTMLADQHAQLPIAEVTEFRAKVLSNIENEAIALHIGQKIPIGELGVVDYLCVSSPSVSKAMENLSRYFRLVAHPDFGLSYSEQDGSGLLEYGRQATGSSQFDLFEQQSVEFTFSVTLSRIRAATGSNVVAKSLGFCHEKPGYVQDYEELFQAPIVFGASQNVLVLSEECLELTPDHRDTHLHQMLSSYADAAISKLPQGKGVAHMVLQILNQEFDSGEPTVNSVAKKLFMSPRTLHRKLNDENTSFATLKDSLRYELAQSMLANSEMTIADISFLLGFSQPSAFNRAFKRWTGFAPQIYRDRRPKVSGNSSVSRSSL